MISELCQNCPEYCKLVKKRKEAEERLSSGNKFMKQMETDLMDKRRIDAWKALVQKNYTSDQLELSELKQQNICNQT